MVFGFVAFFKFTLKDFIFNLNDINIFKKARKISINRQKIHLP